MSADTIAFPARRVTVACMLMAMAVAVVFHFTPAREALDAAALDAQFRSLRMLHPVPLDNDVVVVGMDDATFKQFTEPVALWHGHIGELFQALSQADPSVVGVDVVLPDRSFSFLGERYDRSLLQGILALKPIAPLVLAQTVDGAGNLRPVFPPLVAVAGSDTLGLVVVNLDRDQVARRYKAGFESDAGTLPSLAGLMATKLGFAPGHGYVNYALGDAFDYLPMHELLDLHRAGEHAALRQRIAGRPVLVGLMLPFEDVVSLPVSLAQHTPARVLPGVLLHAQALRSMMNGGLLGVLPDMLVLPLALLGFLLAWMVKHPPRAWLAGLAGLAAFLAVSTAALASGIVVPVATMFVAVILALTARTASVAAWLAHERRRLRQSFSSSVSPAVMEAILDGRVTPARGGERRQLCLLFSDIRGFTTYSETHSPEQVIALLDEYFEAMTEVVHAHGGTVASFMGDGLMCFFGAPAMLENPSRNAFDAARDMLDELSDLNASLAQRGLEPVQIGIGLHYGEAMVGHVGSSSRNDYTAIGDAVNVASRIEGLTKNLGYRVLVSEPVAAALGDGETLVALGEQSIKGRAAVTVFGWASVHSSVIPAHGPRREQHGQQPARSEIP